MIWEQSEKFGIRFICDFKKKRVYAFDGFNLTHRDVTKKLEIYYGVEQTNFLYLSTNKLLPSMIATIDKNDNPFNIVYYDIIHSKLKPYYRDLFLPYIQQTLDKDWSFIYEWIDKDKFEKEKSYILKKIDAITSKL